MDRSISLRAWSKPIVVSRKKTCRMRMSSISASSENRFALSPCNSLQKCVLIFNEGCRFPRGVTEPMPIVAINVRCSPSRSTGLGAVAGHTLTYLGRNLQRETPQLSIEVTTATEDIAAHAVVDGQPG